MNKNATQELLPPLADEPMGLHGWLDWLTVPLPGHFMLPATGLLIMGLDWLFFSEDAVTFGLALPFTITAGFLSGAIGTYLLQRKYALDTRSAASFKGLVAGVLVGLPFPLAGTLVGAWILTTSGIAGLKDRLWKQRMFRR